MHQTNLSRVFSTATWCKATCQNSIISIHGMVLKVVSLGIGMTAATLEFGRARNALKCPTWLANVRLAVSQEHATEQIIDLGCAGLQARISPTHSAKVRALRVLANTQILGGRSLRSASTVVKRWVSAVTVTMRTWHAM